MNRINRTTRLTLTVVAVLAAQAAAQVATTQPLSTQLPIQGSTPTVSNVASPGPAPVLTEAQARAVGLLGVTLSQQQVTTFNQRVDDRNGALRQFDDSNAPRIVALQDALTRVQDPVARARVQQHLIDIENRRLNLQVRQDRAILRQVLTVDQITARNRAHLEARVQAALGDMPLTVDQQANLARLLDQTAATVSPDVVLGPDRRRAFADSVLTQVLTAEQRLALEDRRIRVRDAAAGAGNAAGVGAPGAGDAAGVGIGGSSGNRRGRGSDDVGFDDNGGLRGRGRGADDVGFDDNGGLRSGGGSDDILVDDNVVFDFDGLNHHGVNHRSGGSSGRRGRGSDDIFDDNLFSGRRGRGSDDGSGSGSGRRGRGSDDVGLDDNGGGRGRGSDDAGLDDNGGRRSGGDDGGGSGSGGDSGRGRGRGGDSGGSGGGSGKGSGGGGSGGGGSGGGGGGGGKD